MSNKSGRRFWYKITQVYDPRSKRVRRHYAVECRCGAKDSFHASSNSDASLRKIFLKRGWNIGRTPNNHLCPRCRVKVVRPAVITTAHESEPREKQSELCDIIQEAVQSLVSVEDVQEEPVADVFEKPVEDESDVADWWKQISQHN